MEKKIKPTQLPAEEVGEVVDFLDAKDRLEAFRDENKEVLDQWAEILEEYNARREAADQKLRALKKGCGPWVLNHFATTYNAVALYEAVGKERFAELGGTVKTTTDYEVDRARLETAITLGKVPSEVVDRVRKETPYFSAPKKVTVA